MAIEVIRRTPEQIAGETYLSVWESLNDGQHGMRRLALHIPYVLGYGTDKIEHWRRREIPNGRAPLLIELDKPEDYFIKKPREGLGLESLYFLDGAMKLLGKNGSDALICLRKSIPDWDDRIERERMKQTVKEAPVLAGHGAIGNGRKDESRLDIIKSTNGGTSAEYLTSRLKRDAPAIAARLQRGEFKSVRAAAIEAGIVIVPSVLEQAKRAFLKLSDLDRNEFLSWVYGEWR